MSIYLKKILLLTFTPFVICSIFGNVAHAVSNTPALSLDNTNFVVSLAFIGFLAIILYLRVPTKISGLLDDRSKSIENDINNANLILEESKTLLANLEREHKINIEKAKNIVVEAETEAKNILSEAKKEVRLSIERKVKLAEDQIKATEDAVIKSIKDRAIDQSILMAETELSKRVKSKNNDSMVNESLKILDSELKRLRV